MKVYVLVNMKNNDVFGVCSTLHHVRQAKEKLNAQDSNMLIDYIECPLNEIEYDEQIIYKDE